jgi:hypothetical protein
MSSMHGTDDESRWVAAQQIASGRSDDGLPRRRWMVWATVVAVTGVAMALGLLLPRLLPSPTVGTGTEAGDWPADLVVSAALLVLAIAIAIPGWLWAAKTGRLVPRWRSVTSPLPARDRKWVTKRIRSAAPVDDELKLSVVLAVAAQNRHTAFGAAPLHASIVLAAISTGLRTSSGLAVWLEAVVAVAFIATYGLLIRDFRSAGRYLAKFGRRPA